MKKWLKITLISLGSLLGLIVIVIAVACWLIFTPSRLTPIVNSLAEKYILCETSFGKVDLTLFKTFPDAGLEVHDISIINPTEGAPSDTVARIASLTVGINVKEYLKNSNIVVRKLRIDDVEANIYVAADGSNNYTIFPTSNDTTPSEPFQMPEMVDLDNISINKLNCRYADQQNGIDAAVNNLALDINASLSDASKGKAKIRLDIDKVGCTMTDSDNAELVNAAIDAINLKLDGSGSAHALDGRLRLNVKDADVTFAGTRYINDALRQSDLDIMDIDMPFSANLDSNSITLNDAAIALDCIKLTLDGVLKMASAQQPMTVDMKFATNDIVISDVLPYLPDKMVTLPRGMAVDARLQADGHAKGIVQGDTLPVVDCHLTLGEGQFAYSVLPAKVKNIAADLTAALDLSQATPSSVKINTFTAQMNSNKIHLTGKIDDLMGDMDIDVNADGSIVLSDVLDFLPDTMPLSASGTAKINLAARTTMKQISNMDIQHMRIKAKMDIDNLDATYDSIHALSPHLALNVQMPSPQRRIAEAELADLNLSSDKLEVELPSSKTTVQLKNAQIAAGVSNLLDKKKPLQAALSLSLARTDAHLDSISVGVDNLHINGKINYDSTRSNILSQLDPRLSVAFSRTSLFMPSMPEAVRLTSFQFDYKPGRCEVAESDIHWGLSDYHLSGTLLNLEEWLDHTKPLDADLSFTSSYTDIDQIMNLISGMGSDEDTLQAMRQEDGVDDAANPFIVPLDMNVMLHTHVKRCVAFGNDLSDLAGNISIRNGKVILDQVGFVCKAARMQLTGIYKSPRPNHLYLGVDFHLLDIQIGELIDMIPYVDTLIPMLKSFDGGADFHLALETYLDAHYSPKTSTLLGSSAISGKNLVVIPGETFDLMAKYLMFNKKTENRIDSLDVELTLFRNRIDVYPFLASIDKYQVCVSGVHSLDNACNYHVELLKSPLPVRLAVDVTGKLPKPNVSLGKVKYNELYNPEKTDAIKQRTLEIKKMVREALESNVR